MSDTVMLAVLGAALLHAIWNALVKGSSDKTLGMLAVVVGQGLAGVAVLPFVDAPSIASLPWLLASIALHLGYQFTLVQAYRFGDLSQVYPIARGSAPLIVTVISIVFLGVALSGLQLIAVLLIVVGVTSVCLVRRGDGTFNGAAASCALVTGVFIASYSLVDGIGARQSGSALGFYGWLAIGNALVVLLASPGMRTGILHDLVFSAKRTTVFGGGASFVAYALVVWAFTQAPIALVTALRETSIVFALLIGVFHLKERLSLLKVAATVATVLGAVTLRFAR